MPTQHLDTCRLAMRRMPWLLIAASVALPALRAQNDWPAWGHDTGNQRHSPLKQISASNVSKLVPAWTYAMKKEGVPSRSAQSTPLMVGGILYLSFPFYRVVALEPETGKVLWDFTGPGKPGAGFLGTMRGLAYWAGDKQTPPQILFGTDLGQLYSLNAKTGKPNPGFGNEGIVNLKTSEVMNGFPNSTYGISSAPAVYKNLVFTGGGPYDSRETRGPAGDVRAWDLRTGKLVWTFHTVPKPGEVGHDSWQGETWKGITGVNVWSFFSLDAKRGVLYMPIGSANFDYYGADRPGSNLFANSLVAVDAETGKLKWHFQAIHHDIWDYDLPMAPALFDVVKDGKKIPAVATMSKTTLLFILDRVTGKPIHGVEERAVPKGDVPGEYYSPTQPFPLKPPPLARTTFPMQDIAKITPEHEAACRELYLKTEGGHNKGLYTPFNMNGTLVMPSPGYGGAEWSGGTFDPSLGYFIVNTWDSGDMFSMAKVPDAAATAALGQPPVTQYNRVRGPNFTINGMPCWQPPWSRLTAVNVSTGEVAWQIPFGGAVEGVPAGMNTGAPNASFGGPTSTAGGVTFIGAAPDRYFRAYDSKSGKELWSAKMDEQIRGNPITYMGKDGKQYVAVPAGTTFVTYKLP